MGSLHLRKTKKWFTLHFATINTITAFLVNSWIFHLQYTLLLLILLFSAHIFLTVLHLHYTLLLLILTGKTLADEELANLHYTLLLLIRQTDDRYRNRIKHLHYTLLLLIQLFILLNIYNIIFLFFCRTLIFYKK